MKFLAVFALAVACASADVSHVVGHSGEAAAETIQSTLDVEPDGTFQYGYETSNNIAASASGTIKDPNAEYPTQEVRGQYKYVGPDGVVYEVSYVANENGFQPQGAHLPVAPAVPEAIQRSLAYIAANPQRVVSEPFVQAARVAVPTVPAYKPQAFRAQPYKF